MIVPGSQSETGPRAQRPAALAQMAGAPGPVEPMMVSTAGLPPAQRFDAWCSHFGRLNDVMLPTADRLGFQASSLAWRLGGLVLTSNQVPAMRLRRTGLHAARDGLDHWTLRVARRGSVRSRIGDATFRTAAGDLVFFSLADPFEGEWTAAEWVSLSIPRDLMPVLGTRLAALRPGPQAGLGARLLAEFLLALPRHLSAATAGDLPVLAETVRAMVSASLLAGAPEAAAGSASLPSMLARERVRRTIRQNIGSPRLTPEFLCRAAGVSRSSLYRMFEPEGGVARHVQQVRLTLMLAALSDVSRAGCSIAALAEAHGFHDASAFSRAFRRAFGQTPREARAAAMRGAAPPAGAMEAAFSGRDFAALLRAAGAPPGRAAATPGAAGKAPGPASGVFPGPARAG